MTIKVTKHAPPPVEQPPATYTLEGLTESDMRFLRGMLNFCGTGGHPEEFDNFAEATKDFMGKGYDI